MTDRMTKEQRHRCMSRIRSRNTQPELIVRRFLFAHGFRYRVNVKTLPGTPDIVLRKYKTVIFVNGCFWHGHENCRSFVLPKSNTDYWKAKIDKNRIRDKRDHFRLHRMGWRVIRLWECQLKPDVRRESLDGLLSVLNRRVLSMYSISEQSLPLAAEEKTEYGGQIRNR